MPTTVWHWLWFLYFAIGSAAGWMVLGIIVADAWKAFRK